MNCENCGKTIEGRSDKKFCDKYCKSQFHYLKQKEDVSNIYYKIDKQIKLNRKILKAFNRSGKSVVRKTVLVKEGFNPNYFTHYWKNNKGDVYLFVYDYGFLKTVENQIEKYVLIMHQNYMGFKY